MKYLFIIAAIVLNITNAMAQSIIIKAEPITPEYHGEELKTKIRDYISGDIEEDIADFIYGSFPITDYPLETFITMDAIDCMKDYSRLPYEASKDVVYGHFELFDIDTFRWLESKLKRDKSEFKYDYLLELSVLYCRNKNDSIARKYWNLYDKEWLSRGYGIQNWDKDTQRILREVKSDYKAPYPEYFKILKNGDLSYYNQMKKKYPMRKLLLFSIILANKYKNPEACYDVYKAYLDFINHYGIVKPSVRLNILRMSMPFLKKGAAMGNIDCKKKLVLLSTPETIKVLTKIPQAGNYLF